MKFPYLFAFFAAVGVACASGLPLFDLGDASQVRVSPFGPSSIVTNNGDCLDLVLKAGPDRWQGCIITPAAAQYFDLSGGSVMCCDVENCNDFPMSFRMEIVNLKEGKGSNDFAHIAHGAVALLPGEKASLRVRFGRIIPETAGGWAPQGMQRLFDGFDSEQNLVPEKVAQLRLWGTAGQDSDMLLTLSNFRLEEPPAPLSDALKSAESFYPFIDRFGQYRHAQWPGKLHDESELALRKAAEDADLAAHPRPEGHDRFGGWADGPKIDSKGGWMTTKYQGKWYLVDPDGNLFWSLGMNSIDYVECDPTGISYREKYFAELPAQSSAIGSHCFTGKGFPAFTFYKGKQGPISQFYFHRYNCALKYGVENEYRQFLERSQKRLRSWGFNTNGNWLEPDVLKGDHLPYITCITFRKFYRVIEGCKLIGWQKFPDIFDPGFEDGMTQALRGHHKSAAEDIYCIGFFMDNELSWGKTDHFLAEGALRSPAGQPAKIALADTLKAKYATIDRLNDAWNGDYASWAAFLESTADAPDLEKAKADLVAFNDVIVNRYFETCKRVINREAPGKLYFGCRFNDWNVKVIKTAAKYLDGTSFNCYNPEVGRWALPDGIDMPVIIGEWHFGTAGFGPPHSGLQAAADQRDRARAFDRYVRSALWNPLIIGAHYFKYVDQAATGRPADGENIQCGFVDVTDTPYADMVEAARKIGADMYRYRSEQ